MIAQKSCKKLLKSTVLYSSVSSRRLKKWKLFHLLTLFSTDLPTTVPKIGNRADDNKCTRNTILEQQLKWIGIIAQVFWCTLHVTSCSLVAANLKLDYEKNVYIRCWAVKLNMFDRIYTAMVLKELILWWLWSWQTGNISIEITRGWQLFIPVPHPGNT
jgi:hypothetical protein